jgi:N-acetylated-alpha-linked acidic dipeptidase
MVYCGWDAEEPALLGSTEWVEDHAEELRRKAVVYINTDGNSRGFISGGGSHTLEPMYNEVIASVIDPNAGVSIRDRRHAKALADADRASKGRLLGNSYQRLSALGAGSDYSGFLQHLGIPSMNIGFGGEGSGGEYHSIYDSYDHFTRFKDPGFTYGILLSKTAGRLALRLANADILPIDFQSLQETVAGYTGEVKTLLENMRTDTETENRLIRDKVYEVSRDPRQPMALPVAREPVPYIDFSPLDNALAALRAEAVQFRSLSGSSSRLAPDRKAELNGILYRAEQSLLHGTGLPRRPWYRHTVYAPGYFTGYGVKTLPGVREAIEQRNWTEAQTQIGILSKALDAYTAEVRKANGLLR